MKSLRTAIASLCLALAGAAEAVDREVQGFPVPEIVTLTPAAPHLTLIGVTVVERSYLPFYTVAVYRETQRGTARGLPSGLEPLRVSIRWLAPKVDAKTMEAFWRDAFAKASGDDAQLARLKAPIQRLVETIGTAERGDAIEFDYNPESGLHVVRDGAVLAQLPGLEFNRLFLSIWLGEKADPAVRDALLGVFKAGSTTAPTR
jgi:hypothetical protein